MYEKFLELPNEMLVKILNELDLVDLIRCRLLSKKFKSLVDTVKREELIILNDYPFQIKNYLAHSSLNFSSLKNTFQPKQGFEFMKTPLFQNLFKNLKALYVFIEIHSEIGFDLDILKEFNYLESLNFSPYLFPGDLVVDLPYLKEFTLLGNYSRWIHPIGEPVYLRSKLKRIHVHCCYNKFIFENPENVQHLEYSDDDCAPLDISKFEKLKTLKCPSFIYGNSLDVIKTFQELEQLNIKEGLNDAAKGLINELLKLKSQNLNKIKKICHNEIEITEPIDEHFDPSRKTFDSLEYKKLSRSLSNTSIDFDVLNELLQNNKEYLDELDKDVLIPKLPVCFFEKFGKIRSVTISRLEDEDEFLDFLRRCNFLVQLDIRESKSNMSQNFIDQLPLICRHSMYYLSIGKVTDEKLNYDPISQLRYLGDLTIDCEIEPTFMLKMFKECRNLEDVRVYYLSSRMSISKIKKQFSFFEDLDYIYKEFNRKISKKMYEENLSKKREMYSVKYFNAKLSRYGFNSQQLEEYLSKSIGTLRERELKKGRKLEKDYIY